MKREYPDQPIIGVGGIIFQDRNVLLVKRAKSPGKGQWSLPGGAIELGEPVREALRREIFEETSINITIEGLVRVLDKILYDEQNRVRFHYVIADYWGRFLSGRLRADSDISDANFFAINQIRDMDIDGDVKDTVAMAVRMKEG
jgi:8-oxo-dGTP diphosphatase